MRLPTLLLLFLILAAAGTSLAQPRRLFRESNFTIRNLEWANTEEDEYSPYMTPSGEWLYFTSSRSGASGVYRSRRAADKWGDPEYIPYADVNTPQDDGSFSAPIPMLAELFPLDERMMQQLDFPGFGILTSGDRADGIGDADLYTLNVSYDGVDLNNVRLFSALSTEEWDAQGAVAPDGSFIIFSSNRAEGGDEMDLFISMRTADGGYAVPVNIGDPVNTSGNEFSPFIAPDGRTLFFASTGHDGFGGADLFMTTRDENGTWSTPENLGEQVNTSANELFFFGMGRDRCFFVSDRSGGQGGLDLYEGRPNIFAAGYAEVRVAIVDTTTGKPVRGHVRVVESTFQLTVAEAEIPEQGADLDLFIGASYHLEFSPSGFPTATRALERIRVNTRNEVILNVGSIPPQPKFVLNAGNLDLRWFVSGYYRINTPALLEELRQKQRGELRRQTYIANVAGKDSLYNQYSQQAGRVQEILDDFYSRAVKEYFPAYLKGKRVDEYLEITVYGYADPRAVIGRYTEKPITFYGPDGQQVQVNTGESLTNFKLAGLRAYYAVEFFDRLFRDAATKGYPEYRALVERGLIRWRPVSGDVDTSGGEDLSQLRRVRIDFRRMTGEGTEIQ